MAVRCQVSALAVLAACVLTVEFARCQSGVVAGPNCLEFIGESVANHDGPALHHLALASANAGPSIDPCLACRVDAWQCVGAVSSDRHVATVDGLEAALLSSCGKYHCSPRRITHSSDKRATVRALSTALIRVRRMTNVTRQPELHVLVAGAGPAGMLSALHARTWGARVTVLDRRHDYTRSIWFDLEAPAQTLLRKLGAAPLVETLGGVQQEGGIVTVQCLRLERFLSTMLALMAVNIVHGATFLSLRQREAVVDVGCGSDVACGSLALAASVTKPRGCAAVSFASVVLGAAHASCVETTVSAHVIVAADGTHSRARQALLSPLQSWHTQDTVLPVSTEDAESGLLLPHELRSARADAWDVHGALGLHQTSLLLRLAPLHGGGCPPKRAYGVNGKVASPFDAAFAFPDVVSVVFKRFFGATCELQVLLTNVGAARLGVSSSSRAVHNELRSCSVASALAAPTRACSNDTELWLTLLSVVNHSLRSDAAFASVHALQQGLQPAVDGVVPRLRLPEIPLVVALQTRIGRAPVLAGRLGEANRPSLLFSVQGDARMTAHYRLGIGLNNIVSTTEELRAMLDVAEAYVATSETATVRSHYLLAELQLSAERATDILVQRQAHVLFHEAVCGSVVFRGQVLGPDHRRQAFVDVHPADMLGDLQLLRGLAASAGKLWCDTERAVCAAYHASCPVARASTSNCEALRGVCEYDTTGRMLSFVGCGSHQRAGSRKFALGGLHIGAMWASALAAWMQPVASSVAASSSTWPSGAESTALVSTLMTLVHIPFAPLATQPGGSAAPNSPRASWWRLRVPSHNLNAAITRGEWLHRARELHRDVLRGLAETVGWAPPGNASESVLAPHATTPVIWPYCWRHAWELGSVQAGLLSAGRPNDTAWVHRKQ